MPHGPSVRVSVDDQELGISVVDLWISLVTYSSSMHTSQLSLYVKCASSNAVCNLLQKTQLISLSPLSPQNRSMDFSNSNKII